MVLGAMLARHGKPIKPAWLAQDIEGLSVYCVGYEASCGIAIAPSSN
jgi:hypothetical protein